MVRVLIVDDHAIFRAGLKQIIADESDLEVAGEAGNAQDAIELARGAGRGDVMLLVYPCPTEADWKCSSGSDK